MNGTFEWLIKLVFILLLAPCLLSLGMALVSAALWAFLPWAIGLGALIGLVAGLVAGLVVRCRLPPPVDLVPPGDVPRIRRPRGVRTDR